MSTDITTWTKEVPSQTSITFGTIMRVELHKTDAIVCNSKRAEIHADRETPLEEHVYSFDLLIPSGGNEDYKCDENEPEIICQYHNTRDTNEDWTTPPLSLDLFDGQYIVQRCWDDAEITSDEIMSSKNYREKINLGSYIEDKGHWVRWKFHIKWGWLKSQNPILEIYKDDKKVLDRNGLPNTTNDKIGNCMKLGIYKPAWALANDDSEVKDKRIIYYKDVNIE